MTDRDRLVAELAEIDDDFGQLNDESFQRICEIADALFDGDFFADAERAYWKLVPDCYRLGDVDADTADAFLCHDLWRFYEAEDFHEFDKWASATPSISRFGDRVNLASLLEDIAYAMWEQQKLAEAERTLRLTVALCPREKRYHDCLARILKERGNPLWEVAGKRCAALKDD